MGKKVRFVKNYINKNFEDVEDLRNFMEEYAEECDSDFEYLAKMYEYLGGEVEDDEEFEEFKNKQKAELDEFLSHDEATVKDLKEFMENQKKDLLDFINGEEEDTEEECVDLKDLVKEAVREVLNEMKEVK